MDTCEIKFERFDLEAYDRFLKAKSIPEFTVLTGEDGMSDGLRFPSRFAHLVGMKVENVHRDWLPMPDFLFDDQREIISMALEAKRFADWKDCGLGKTLEQAEWARQVQHITGNRVLIVTLNDIVQQWIEEAKKFYGDYPIVRLDTREQMRKWCAGEMYKTCGHCHKGAIEYLDAEGVGAGLQICGACDGYGRVFTHIAITNYEKFNPTDGCEVVSEVGMLGGLALDESSRLKTGGGKQKWSIIKSSRGVPYKLSATGTPAPNDVMEFASQASFLERIRDEGEVIWTYFTRGKDNEWTVKKHARPHFFRWMAAWSIYVADPRAYGWRLDSPDVPQPEFHYLEIEPTPEQIRLQHAASAGEAGTGDLFGDKRLGMVTQLQLLEAAKGFIYTKHWPSGVKGFEPVPSNKPGQVALLAKKQFKQGRQILVWCEYDAEVEILAQRLEVLELTLGKDFQTLGGSTPMKQRLPILEAFRKGELPLLISKARMLGYGMNFQKCTCHIFSGFSDSFESFYQAVRRSYRYGQTEPLQVYIPHIQILEGPVLRNLLNKSARFNELIREQQDAYIAARKELAA